MATSNSADIFSLPGPLTLLGLTFRTRPGRILLLALCLTGLARAAGSGGEAVAIEAAAAARAEHAFVEARARARQETNNADVAWQFARACFDWAEFARSDEQRAELADQGIAASRLAIAQNPGLAAAHFYLAMNLGQLARTKSLGALKLVVQMEAAFKRAIELDPGFDYAGAHRSLGILYRDAPGWPTSIGSRSKARLHLQKAVELCSDYPENQLCLLESFVQWGDRKVVLAELPRVEALFQAAHGKLTGEDWAFNWQDWQARWEKIKVRALASTPALESPRNKK